MVAKATVVVGIGMGLTEGISKATLLYMGCNVWGGLSLESRRLQVMSRNAHRSLQFWSSWIPWKICFQAWHEDVDGKLLQQMLISGLSTL